MFNQRLYNNLGCLVTCYCRLFLALPRIPWDQTHADAKRRLDPTLLWIEHAKAKQRPGLRQQVPVGSARL